MTEYWFVRLVELARVHWFVVFLGLFAVLAVVFLGLFKVHLGPSANGDFLSDLGTGLFFAFINAYTIVGGAYVIWRSEAALLALKDTGVLSETAYAEYAPRVRALPRSAAIWVVIASLAGGIIHSALLSGGFGNILAALADSTQNAGAILGAMLTWFVVSHAVTAFARNAGLFGRIGDQHFDVSVATPENLAPFGTMAVVPTLGLVGTQAAYPLLSLGGVFTPVAVLPGFIGTLIALVYLFIRPSWSLHKRLRTAKQQEQARIESELTTWRRATPNPMDDGMLAKLQPLLSYREYVTSLPVWPFDVGVFARWGFYVIIPPLTWVAAAFVEVLIERAV